LFFLLALQITLHYIYRSEISRWVDTNL
jgi:hypothetical protein